MAYSFNFSKFLLSVVKLPIFWTNSNLAFSMSAFIFSNAKVKLVFERLSIKLNSVALRIGIWLIPVLFATKTAISFIKGSKFFKASFPFTVKSVIDLSILAFKSLSSCNSFWESISFNLLTSSSICSLKVGDVDDKVFSSSINLLSISFKLFIVFKKSESFIPSWTFFSKSFKYFWISVTIVLNLVLNSSKLTFPRLFFNSSITSLKSFSLICSFISPNFCAKSSNGTFIFSNSLLIFESFIASFASDSNSAL